MSDAASAIYNGFRLVYPGILPGKCFFHMIKNMKEQVYSSKKIKKAYINDLRSLGKSFSQCSFDAAVELFLKKYLGHENVSLANATSHLSDFWLKAVNSGWHSGLLPGTSSTNNGLEATNRVFKADFKGTLLQLTL